MYILYKSLELCYEQEKTNILIQLQKYIVYNTIKICNNIIKKERNMKIYSKSKYYNIIKWIK